MGKKKVIEVDKSFRYTDKTDEYTLRLRRRNYWWLLLLLLLLLLIRCRHDITVTVVDRKQSTPVEGVTVNLDYTSHILLKDGRLLCHTPHHIDAVTGKDGKAVFRDMECSVFSYIFYCLNPATIAVESDDCITGDTTTCNFHYICHETLAIDRCHPGVTVHVVDRDTGDDIPAAEVTWSETPRGTPAMLTTDGDGRGPLEGAAADDPVTLRVMSKAKGYADTTYVSVSIPADLQDDGSILIKMRPLNEDYHVDIVMCIDNTGSMRELLNMVKSNALRFHSDLKNYCAGKWQSINQIRVRVIAFGDFTDSNYSDSGLLIIPDEQATFSSFVNSINITDGGDEPEDSFEALAMAMDTPWNKDDTRCRYIIIMYTDATPHELGYTSFSPRYPAGMPADYRALTAKWRSLNRQARRLVLFAPENPAGVDADFVGWSNIAADWDNVIHKKENLRTVLSGAGYNDILEAISKSL